MPDALRSGLGGRSRNAGRARPGSGVKVPGTTRRISGKCATGSTAASTTSRAGRASFGDGSLSSMSAEAADRA